MHILFRILCLKYFLTVNDGGDDVGLGDLLDVGVQEIAVVHCHIRKLAVLDRAQSMLLMELTSHVDSHGAQRLLAGDGMMHLQVVIKELDNLFTCVWRVPASRPTTIFVLGVNHFLQRFHEAGVGREADTLHLHIVGRNLIGIGEMGLDGVALRIGQRVWEYAVLNLVFNE